jgi:hypothetical protein
MSLEKLEQHIPFVGALLKEEQDVEALNLYDEKGGRYPKNWSELGPRYNQHPIDRTPSVGLIAQFKLESAAGGALRYCGGMVSLGSTSYRRHSAKEIGPLRRNSGPDLDQN